MENSTLNFKSNGTSILDAKDGYDVPVFGLDNGKFSSVHLTALSCITVSFIFTIFVLVMSFRTANGRFFSLAKSDRLIVYLSTCDGIFNIAHSLDHLHIFITHDHVRPRELCTLYAFMIGEFISAQMLMVNIVAINVFSIIFLEKDMSFGKYDWKLLTYTFGIPFVVYLVAAVLGKLGPTGSFCHFDAVKGTDLYVYYLVVLTFIVFVINSALYVITWIRLYNESRHLASILGTETQTAKNLKNTARNMSLFVLAFFIQWFSLVAYAISGLIGHIPDVIIYLAISFNNIGGVLNGIVFIIIRFRKRERPRNLKKNSTFSSTQTVSVISSQL